MGISIKFRMRSDAVSFAPVAFMLSVKEIMLNRGMTQDADALNNQYLTNPYSVDKLKYKLKPLVADDEVYQKIVMGE